MKASEEIACDLFIKQCISRGISDQRDIIEEAEGSDQVTVENLIESGNSVFEDVISEEDLCDNCTNRMMWDDSKEEYYCPLCL